MDVAKQLLDQADAAMDLLFKPRERRFVDAPSSVLVEERRRVNIATVSNHSDECLSLIRASGECCCEQQEAE